jgi:hypothetical protein
VLNLTKPSYDGKSLQYKKMSDKNETEKSGLTTEEAKELELDEQPKPTEKTQVIILLPCLITRSPLNKEKVEASERYHHSLVMKIMCRCCLINHIVQFSQLLECVSYCQVISMNLLCCCRFSVTIT